MPLPRQGNATRKRSGTRHPAEQPGYFRHWHAFRSMPCSRPRAAQNNNKRKYHATAPQIPLPHPLRRRRSDRHPPASAAFVEDSKASIDLRNFYMNRDFRSGTGQSKAEEWAQGFMLKMESGYTEGPIGFGVDAIGLLGVKLDSSPDRVGTGILQSDRDAPTVPRTTTAPPV